MPWINALAAVLLLLGSLALLAFLQLADRVDAVRAALPEARASERGDLRPEPTPPSPALALVTRPTHAAEPEPTEAPLRHAA
jgi:hypothetical protein